MSTLSEHVDSLPIVSAHEHHISFNDAVDYTTNHDALARLFGHGYVAWANTDFEDRETRSRFLDLIAGNSYLVRYEKALDDLFDFGGEITVTNWDTITPLIVETTVLPK